VRLGLSRGLRSDPLVLGVQDADEWKVEGEAQAEVIRHPAQHRQLSRAVLDLVMELGHVGVGHIGGQVGSHAIHTDILPVEIHEDVTQVGEANAEMRLVLPASAVVGLESRLPQNLDGESKSHT